ncbi:MAG: hypothetical protein NTU76_01025 [Candidatus Taylorbacteria bacterium]|nr:hypothetical protein [Candidatus Taylorbacteria bacterium]
MKKFNDFLRKKKYLLLLIFASIITHLQWFNPFSILNYSDWSYWPNEATSQLYNSYGTWINFSNFGLVNIQLPFNLFTFIWSLIVNLGSSYDFATKITFLIPIAILGFIAPYILFKKLIKDELASFVVALFYGASTYFLIRQTAHIPIAFIYALTPFILYFFIRALENNKLVNWLFFILVYWTGSCYEIRITYIVTLILFLYFVFCHILNIKKHWKNILLGGCCFISLSFFWLLSISFGRSFDSILAVANRGLFGNFLFDIEHAFALSNDPWTGGLLNNQFIKQPIIWYFWFLPLISFSVFLFKPKNFKYKKEVVFFGVVSLIGIFLTKQSTEPLVGAYLWLYNNFPGFNLFRDASKFYLLTAIGYTGLLGYSLLVLKEHKNEILNKYVFFVFSIIIIFISVWNVKPLITGEIRTMFVSRNIPTDYLVLKYFILKQPDYFRTMYIPTDSRWGIFTNQKPKISDIAVIDSEWKNLLKNYNENEKLTQDKIINVFKLPFAENLMDNSSIKYVIVPLQDVENDDDFFVSYGGDKDPNIREWYIKELDKVDWLKKIDIGTQDLVVYENESYKPHIYLTKEKETIYSDVAFQGIDWQFKNPTEYKISLKNLSKIQYLDFSESFHSDWKLRVGDFNWFKVLTDKNYFLPDDFHIKNNANLNTFKIDPDYIKQNFPKEDYKENPDGSIDVELTLYFKPQSYFYLGLIISGVTLLGCLGYLGYDFVKRRKRKEIDTTVEENEKNK